MIALLPDTIVRTVQFTMDIADICGMCKGIYIDVIVTFGLNDNKFESV